MAYHKTPPGPGDNQRFRIDFDKLPIETVELVIVANIYSGGSFSKVNNAYIRICNSPLVHSGFRDGHEYAKFGIGPIETRGVILGELKKGENNWNFKAVEWPCEGSAPSSQPTMDAVILRKVEEPEPEPELEPIVQEEEVKDLTERETEDGGKPRA